MTIDSNQNGFSRRDVLCMAGASLLARLVSGLLGGVTAARAETLSGSVPEVDRLAVRVVIDSYQLAIDRKSTRLNSSHIQKSRMPSSA